MNSRILSVLILVVVAICLCYVVSNSFEGFQTGPEPGPGPGPDAVDAGPGPGPGPGPGTDAVDAGPEQETDALRNYIEDELGYYKNNPEFIKTATEAISTSKDPLTTIIGLITIPPSENTKPFGNYMSVIKNLHMDYFNSNIDSQMFYEDMNKTLSANFDQNIKKIMAKIILSDLKNQRSQNQGSQNQGSQNQGSQYSDKNSEQDSRLNNIEARLMKGDYALKLPGMNQPTGV